MELLIEECCRELRPVYLLDTGDEWSGRWECEWCERDALYVFQGYDTERCDPPVPNMHREATCGAAACAAAEAWFTEPKVGGKRRGQFQTRWGQHFRSDNKPLRLEKALWMMLESTIRKVA